MPAVTNRLAPLSGGSRSAALQQSINPALVTLEILSALDWQDVIEHDRRHGGHALFNRRVVLVDHCGGVDPLVLDEVADEAARIDPDVGEEKA